jgi:hypothetical protein
MGESSIAQARDDRERALRRLLAAFAAALVHAATRAADSETAAGLGDFADLVRAIDPARSVTPSEAAPERLPVCRFWDAALDAAARGAAGPLAELLAVLAPALGWTQNPNYRRRPPGESFLDSYGYAVIAGPGAGPPALARDARLALGVLLLGPGTHYPLHAHPAVEVYYTLSPGGEWWRDPGPWRGEPPGTAIYHAPMVRHAARADTGPLLALYVWRGDLATHARLA